MKMRNEQDGSFHCPQCDCAFRHNPRAWVVIGLPFGFLLGLLFLKFLALASVPNILLSVLVGICVLAICLSPAHYVVTQAGKREKGAVAPTNAVFKLLNSVHGRLVLFLVPCGTIMILYCVARLANAYFWWRIGKSDLKEWNLRCHEFGPLFLIFLLVTIPGYLALIFERMKKRKRKRRRSELTQNGGH